MRRLLISIFAVAGGMAQAAIVANETRARVLNSVADAAFDCKAGVADDGQNAPSPSALTLGDLSAWLPDANVEHVQTDDPQARLGDTCAELRAELAAQLPAALSLTRNVTEQYSWEEGACVRELVESVDASIGTFHLEGGRAFVIETVGESLCPKQE